MVTTKAPAKPQKAPARPVAPEKLKTPVTVLPILMSNGQHDFVIHRQGCKQYPAQKKRSSYAGLEDYVLAGINNQREVIMEVWSDQIHETWQEDTPKGKTAADEAEAPLAWLNKHGYVTSVDFHTCLAGLPQTAKGTGTTAKAATVRKAAKTELASLVAEAAGRVVANLLDETADFPDAATRTLIYSGFNGDTDIAQCVAQWLHGMPTDRTRFLKVLPRPDRSDWREENDAAGSAAGSAEADTDDTPNTETEAS